MPDTREIPQVLAQAEDIAASVGQPLTTAHLLLALFVTPCSAGQLLRERGVGDREVTAVLTRSPAEPAERVDEVLTRAREIAAGVGAPTDSLHLLIAFGRLRGCLAHDLLVRTGLPLAALRNTILSWYTGGRRPKGMEPVGGLAAPAPVAAPARARGRVRAAAAAPAAVPRELRDDEILPGYTVHDRPPRRDGGGGRVAARATAGAAGQAGAVPRTFNHTSAETSAPPACGADALPPGFDRVAAEAFAASLGEARNPPRGADRAASDTSTTAAGRTGALPRARDGVSAEASSTSAGQAGALPRGLHPVAAAALVASLGEADRSPRGAESVAADTSTTAAGRTGALPRGLHPVATAALVASLGEADTSPRGAESVAAGTSATPGGQAGALPRRFDRVSAETSATAGREAEALPRGLDRVAADASTTAAGRTGALPRARDGVSAEAFAASVGEAGSPPRGADRAGARTSATSAGQAGTSPGWADRVAAATSREPISARGGGRPSSAVGRPARVAAATPVRRRSPAEVALDPALFPQLCAFGRNLTEAAAAGKLDPVIGREREVDEVVDILGKRRGNNPVLVGEPGVGKTAVVEGVAQALLAGARPGEPPPILVELEIGSLVAGTSLRGAFSERLGAIKEEVRAAGGRVIVFLDELHTVVGAGSTGDGPQDAANELKTALARGEFPCIGATTWDEYRKYIESDPALERRFTPVRVEEPTVQQTVEILRGLAPRYESHHGVAFEAAALEAAATLSARYIPDRQLPDKAIGLLDLAGSRTRRAGGEMVGVREIAEVVSRIAAVPLDRLLLDDRERLLRLEEDLGRRVVGHRETIGRIARAIRRNYAGFGARRPMGSFLFLGPTGVGKTELARAIAEVLHGTEDALVRVDMSELGEAHTVARLIGAPPGYVGHGEGGQLTEAVRRRPSCVVLFDEIEKAHRDVLLLLLQVLDEGRLTDAQGRTIDFTQSIVVLTSNLGAEAFAARSAPRVGFGAAADEAAERSSRAMEIARAALPPELWNRIDERCLFEPLRREEVAGIARLLLEESARRIASERRIALAFDDEVIDRLLDRGGWDPLLGARPMRQAIQREVEAPLADAILRGAVPDGGAVRARVEGDAIAFVAA